jgi:hypothetical protein
VPETEWQDDGRCLSSSVDTFANWRPGELRNPLEDSQFCPYRTEVTRVRVGYSGGNPVAVLIREKRARIFARLDPTEGRLTTALRLAHRVGFRGLNGHKEAAVRNGIDLLRKWKRAWVPLVVLAPFVVLMAAAPGAGAAQQVISSAGPLNNIYLNDQLSCQATRPEDAKVEFYGGTDPGACGTFLAAGSTSYGDDVPSGNSRTPYTPVSQSGIAGNGTSGAPFQVVTVVDVGSTGLRITQIDSYVVGNEFYRTDIAVKNTTGAPIGATLYHAADCYLQNSDTGFGFFDAPSGGIFCSIDANNSPPARIEGFSPLTGGSHHFESNFDNVWFGITHTGTQFPDTCDCSINQDNGAGLSWPASVPANGTLSFSLLTTFSPTGKLPGQSSSGAQGSKCQKKKKKKHKKHAAEAKKHKKHKSCKKKKKKRKK